MVCLFVSPEEQTQIMVKQNSTSMPPSSLSSKMSLESSTADEDDIDKKRRRLLIRSAKRPFKRSRLLQKQRRQEEKNETDTFTTASLSSASTATTKPSIFKNNNDKLLRGRKRETRRVVSFHTRFESAFVPSHRDLSETERRSLYFQRDEYVGIKRNIQQTMKFLRSPADISSSGSTSSSLETSMAEEHCVRGLECLAEEFVNDHKKRAQKASKNAVFRFQEKRRRRIRELTSADESYKMSLALAEVYKKHTSQCEHIARRWGHFDAIDAGYDPKASSATVVSRAADTSLINNELAVHELVVDSDNNMTIDTSVDNNASLSSLSYDGDDGEEENDSKDDFNASESANEFDSLPNGLFNF